MNETVENVATEGGEGGVQLLPVARVALAVKDGQVVGCELAWEEGAVPSADHAAHVLATLMSGQMDARWVMRQVLRAADGSEETKPH